MIPFSITNERFVCKTHAFDLKVITLPDAIPIDFHKDNTTASGKNNEEPEKRGSSTWMDLIIKKNSEAQAFLWLSLSYTSLTIKLIFKGENSLRPGRVK